jgi:hypothetical protein
MDLTAEQLAELGKQFSKRAKTNPIGKGAAKVSVIKDLFKNLAKEKVSGIFGRIAGPFNAVMDKVKEFRDAVHEKEVEAAEEYAKQKQKEVKELEDELKDTTKSEDEIKKIQKELDDARQEAKSASDDLFKIVGDDLEDYLDEKKKESKDLNDEFKQATKLATQKENMLKSLSNLSDKERKALEKEVDDLKKDADEIAKEMASLDTISSMGGELTGEKIKVSKVSPSTNPTSVLPPSPPESTETTSDSTKTTSDSTNEIVKATVDGFKLTNKNLIQLRDIWGDETAKDDLSKIDPKMVQYVTENTKQFLPEIIKGMEEGIRHEMEEIRKTDPSSTKELEKIFQEIVKTNEISSTETKLIEKQTSLAEQAADDTKMVRQDQKQSESLRRMELKENSNESLTKTSHPSTNAKAVTPLAPTSGSGEGKTGILGTLAGLAMERFMPAKTILSKGGGLLKNAGGGLLKNAGGGLLKNAGGLLKNAGGAILSKGGGLLDGILPSLGGAVGGLGGLAAGAMKLAGPAALALGIGKGLFDYSNESEDETKARGGDGLSAFGRIGDSVTGGLATDAGEKLAGTSAGDFIGKSITKVKSFFGDQDATDLLASQDKLAQMNTPEGKAAALAAFKANKAKSLTPESPKSANTIVPSSDTTSPRTQALASVTTENQTLKEANAAKPIIVNAPTTNNVAKGKSAETQSLSVVGVRNQEGTLRRMLDLQYAI